jgi:hypothetical protein
VSNREFIFTFLLCFLLWPTHAGLPTTADTAAELGPDRVQTIVDKLGGDNTAALAKKLGGSQTGELVTDMGPQVTHLASHGLAHCCSIIRL